MIPVPTPSKTYTPADLAALMSPALGHEKADAVVSSALGALHVFVEKFDASDAKRVLEHIAREEGLVGITGRVALSRFEFGTHTSSKSTSAPKSGARRPLTVVIKLLTPTLGEERASEVVKETATTMGLGDEIELDQALALLEKITRMGGVMGVAARFAKTRVHLSW